MLMKELEPYRLMFIEEPVLSEHHEALAELARYASAPIALGERLYSRWDFKTVLAGGYVDIIQPDPSHAGGITETRKIAAMAEAYDVALALHCPLGPIALAACLQLDAVCYNAFIQEQSLGIHYNQGERPARLREEPRGLRLRRRLREDPGGPGPGDRDRRGVPPGAGGGGPPLAQPGLAPRRRQLRRVVSTVGPPALRGESLMPLHDVTMRLRPGMLAWPGSSPLRQGWDTRLDRGEESNASTWFLGSHSGTHVDAPGHFIPGGAELGALPLELFVGPATVVELPGDVTRIDRAVVESLSLGEDRRRLLFKTSNSALRLDRDVFDPSYVAFTADGARALLELGPGLVGIDYLSIECFDSAGFPAHRTLLGAGVAVIEGLDLRGVAPGRWQLHCLPLRLEGSEAAPARVVLS